MTRPSEDDDDGAEYPRECPTCGHVTPDPKTHVYAVLVPLGGGGSKWLYSEPCPVAVAQREARELRATGHKVEVMTRQEASISKEQRAERSGRRRRR